MSGALRLNVHPTRGVAFVIHLILSLLVFSSLVAMMLVYWFPGDLFFMDGGWEGLKLVALVDLVLGPALTLILFKPGKPGLKIDLAMIAAIQVAALGYGFYTTYDQRTVAVVFAENEFATVSANDRKSADTKLIEMDIVPGALPTPTAFNIPVLMTPAPENFGRYMADILNGKPTAFERTDQFVPVGKHPQDMQRHVKSAEKLQSIGVLDEIQAALAKKDVSMDEMEIYEFRARYADGYVLYDPVEKRIIDYVKVEPLWAKSSVAENAE